MKDRNAKKANARKRIMRLSDNGFQPRGALAKERSMFSKYKDTHTQEGKAKHIRPRRTIC